MGYRKTKVCPRCGAEFRVSRSSIINCPSCREEFRNRRPLFDYSVAELDFIERRNFENMVYMYHKELRAVQRTGSSGLSSIRNRVLREAGLIVRLGNPGRLGAVYGLTRRALETLKDLTMSDNLPQIDDVEELLNTEIPALSALDDIELIGGINVD